MAKKDQFNAIHTRILSYIHSHKLDNGDALPSERKLAELLSTSRNSIREAMRVLETRGIIEIKRGSGCYVKDFNRDFDSIPEMESHDEKSLLVHQIEARLAIEPRIVQLAIERIQDREISQLKKTVSRLSEALLSGNLPVIIEEDNRFRMIIGLCTRNPVICTMVKQLEKNNARFWQVLLGFPDESINIIFAGYVKTLQSIKNREPEMARKHIETHIFEVFKLLTNTFRRDQLNDHNN